MGWTDVITQNVGGVAAAAAWNTYVRDNLNTGVPHAIVRKTADESVASSAVLQDDDELKFTIGASEVWFVSFELMYRADPTADIRIAFTGPAGCLPVLSAYTLDSAGTFTWAIWQALAATVIIGGLSSTLSHPLRIHGHVINSTTAGTFTMQWAQGTGQVTATKVMANSLILGMKIA